MTFAESPLLVTLAFTIADAIEWRESRRRGCCEDGEPCAAHAQDQARAGALGVLLAAMEDAAGDEAVFGALRSVPADVLAEITGTTWDAELAAAITGGVNGGKN
jgi:hypothetical protein